MRCMITRVIEKRLNPLFSMENLDLERTPSNKYKNHSFHLVVLYSTTWKIHTRLSGDSLENLEVSEFVDFHFYLMDQILMVWNNRYIRVVSWTFLNDGEQTTQRNCRFDALKHVVEKSFITFLHQVSIVSQIWVKINSF